MLAKTMFDAAAHVFPALSRLRDETSGLALTEYLILLGLLTGGVVLATLSIGGSISVSWAGWAGFYNSLPSIGNRN